MRYSIAILALAFAAACDDATLPTPAAGAAASYSAPATEGYVTTPDGAQLAYRVSGTGPDTLVILSGGPGLSYRYMADDLQPLSHGRTVIWFDPRGAGRSTLITTPAQASLQQQVADLEVVRQHFGMGRMKLVGHSWGAFVAVTYAAENPGSVERLLLLNPGAVAADPYGAQFDAERVSRYTPAQGELINTLAYQLFTQSTDTPVQVCEQFFATIFSVYFADVANMAGMKGRFCDVPPAAAFAALPTLFAGMGSLGAWDFRQTALPSIHVPVLVVHGTADPIPLASSQAYAAGLSRGTLVVLQNAGHFPWLETPEAFYDAVTPFLNRAFPRAN